MRMVGNHLTNLFLRRYHLDMHMDQKTLDRFWAKVDKTHDCWLWTGAKARGGYGQFWISSQRYRATRLMWMMFKGELPDDLFVCHTCDNPSCVNPDHLFLGTHKQNMEDKVKKGRQNNGRRSKTHCPHGHEYTEETVYVVPSTGARQCKICSVARKKNWRANARLQNTRQ